MPQTKKRPARANGSGLSHTELQLASYDIEATASSLSRQGAPAAWIARRYGLPPATAAAVAHLAGIGCAS